MNNRNQQEKTVTFIYWFLFNSIVNVLDTDCARYKLTFIDDSSDDNGKNGSRSLYIKEGGWKKEANW